MEFGNYPYHSLRHSLCLLNAVLWFISAWRYLHADPSFSAFEKAPFTAIILLTEIVGTVQQVLPLIIVTFISYYVLDLLDVKPIYRTYACKWVTNS